MSIELKEPTLVKHIEQLATQVDRSVEQLLETAIKTYLENIEREAIHAETQAFWARHAELTSKYPSQYVALHQGIVVDHDQDVSQLEKRVRERFGPLPVLIAPVKHGERRDLLWRGGRIEPVEVA